MHAGESLRRLLAALALLAAFGASEAWPQSEGRAAEYQVKAAFLYKFGSFVEWPQGAFARPDSPIVIGVQGADVLAEQLAQTVAARTLGGRPVTVRKLRRGEGYAGLHVLFVGRADNARLPEILEATKGQPMLTVTEAENALALGSIINFVVVDDKVRFDIALPPAEAENVKISARLLAVARKVVQGTS